MRVPSVRVVVLPEDAAPRAPCGGGSGCGVTVNVLVASASELNPGENVSVPPLNAVTVALCPASVPAVIRIVSPTKLPLGCVSAASTSVVDDGLVEVAWLETA